MTYLILKVIHVSSVVIFLGNIITGAFWAARANRVHDFKVIALTFENIIKADKYFTVPGVIGIIIGGMAAAGNAHIPMLSTGWIFWSIVLFIISGIIFMALLGPLQHRILNIARSATENDWKMYNELYKKWGFWGFLSLIAPILAMIIMVLKPNLPGM